MCAHKIYPSFADKAHMFTILKYWAKVNAPIRVLCERLNSALTRILRWVRSCQLDSILFSLLDEMYFCWSSEIPCNFVLNARQDTVNCLFFLFSFRMSNGHKMDCYFKRKSHPVISISIALLSWRAQLINFNTSAILVDLQPSKIERRLLS